jgi:CRP-like cAMP-binding protein
MGSARAPIAQRSLLWHPSVVHYAEFRLINIMDATIIPTPGSSPDAHLGHLAPFRALDPTGRKVLSSRTLLRRHSEGSVLGLQGEPAHHCHVLISGAVVTYTDAVESERIVTLHRPPHVLFLADALGQGVAGLSARTIQPSMVASVPSEVMRGMMEQSTAFAADVAELLSDESRDLTRELLALRTLGPVQRLARWVLEEDEALGGEGTFVSVLSTEEVAWLMGYSYSHFIRKVLRYTAPALAVRGRRWTIADRPALEALAAVGEA